jgi:preprotein translocase subunit SecF
MDWKVRLYSNPKYKYYTLIPISLFIITAFYATQIKLGMELKGGVLITASFTSPQNENILQSSLSQEFNVDVNVRKTTSGDIFLIETGIPGELENIAGLIGRGDNASLEQAKSALAGLGYSPLENESLKSSVERMYGDARGAFRDDLHASLANKGLDEKTFSMNEIGPALSNIFWEQTKMAVLLAFVLMSVIIFLTYRMLIASLVVIFAVTFDIVFSLGLMSMIGIPLTLATVAGLLMIIGYSVDNDVLLMNRMLRKHGTMPERMASALSTGLMTEGTAMVALLVLFIVSSLAQIETLVTISATLLFGILGDVFTTWLMDAVIIRMDFEAHGID